MSNTLRWRKKCEFCHPRHIRHAVNGAERACCFFFLLLGLEKTLLTKVLQSYSSLFSNSKEVGSNKTYFQFNSIQHSLTNYTNPKPWPIPLYVPLYQRRSPSLKDRERSELPLETPSHSHRLSKATQAKATINIPIHFSRRSHRRQRATRTSRLRFTKLRRSEALPNDSSPIHQNPCARFLRPTGGIRRRRRGVQGLLWLRNGGRPR